MSNLKRSINLVLFFTKGMSLQDWDKIGMFDREVVLYERFRDRGVSVSFITYGNSGDLEYRDRLQGINILCNRWSLPNSIYENFLHRFHRKTLKSCDLIKTNQMNGADVALRSAQCWGKPLIVRMGYLWSNFASQENRASDGAVKKALYIENELFSSADRIVVTTAKMAKDVRERIPEVSGKTVIVPNYVDTDRFSPVDTKKDCDILYVGRLANQKNPTGLLEAVMKLKCRTIMIGDGPFGEKLREKYGNLNDLLEWKGNVPNGALPGNMNRSKIFVIPSHYEGQPKTLIEAMSCGMPVIGADSPGIREIIQHGENGWLCSTDVESIGQAIRHLLDNPTIAEKLGNNARQFVLQNYALEDIVEKELKIIKEVAT